VDNKGNRAYVWKCLFVALFTIMFLDVNPQRKNKKLFLHSKMMIEGMRKEEFRIDGNARRIIIKHEGKTPLEFPLTIGVAGVTALQSLHQYWLLLEQLLEL